MLDDELLSLQEATYAAAADYHRASGDCHDCAASRSGTASRESAFLSSAAYGEARAGLLRHLGTLEQTGSVVGEAERARKLIGLLDEEVRLMRDYLSARPATPVPSG